MHIIPLQVSESIMIDDVVLCLEHIMGRNIVFSMEKISGGQRTMVSAFQGQQITVCYNTVLTVLSVNGQTINAGFEAPDSISVRKVSAGL